MAAKRWDEGRMAVAGGSMENTATAALVFLLGHIPRVAGGAKDVVIQKANFAVLSGHLQNMHAVFEEIAGHTIDDDSETREALQKLQAEIIMAQKLVDECVRKSKFFLLLKCRQYAKRLEITTREIGRCLSLLLDSGIEMFPAEREQIRAIENQMQTVEFHAGELEASICDKLEKALTERRDDIELVNSLLEEIAQVCGIPAESSSLTTELASFRMEKEEVLKKKDMADGAYLEQVIAFLSRGDAANSAGQVQREYLLKRSSICDGMISVLPPLQAFLCPITGEIMQDPVSLETGQTYERSAIEEWFGCGNLTCPVTGAAVMKDGNVSLQPNRALKDSIHEWRDHNYVITIRSARVLLESKNVEQQAKALRGLHQACMERASNRCWVNAEGVLPACSDVLKSENKGLRIVALQALLTIVKDHDKNKETVADCSGLKLLLRCIVRGIPEEAELGMELLRDLAKLPVVCDRIGQAQGGILVLSTMLTSESKETSRRAQEILDMLASKDEHIIKMAEANIFKPLMNRLIQGSMQSRAKMLCELSNMELMDQTKSELAHGGILPAVADVLSRGKPPERMHALKVIHGFSSAVKIQPLIWKAGAVPAVLMYLLSPRTPMHLKETAAATLANLLEDATVECPGICAKQQTATPLWKGDIKQSSRGGGVKFQKEDEEYSFMRGEDEAENPQNSTEEAVAKDRGADKEVEEAMDVANWHIGEENLYQLMDMVQLTEEKVKVQVLRLLKGLIDSMHSTLVMTILREASLPKTLVSMLLSDNEVAEAAGEWKMTKLAAMKLLTSIASDETGSADVTEEITKGSTTVRELVSLMKAGRDDELAVASAVLLSKLRLREKPMAMAMLQADALSAVIEATHAEGNEDLREWAVQVLSVMIGGDNVDLQVRVAAMGVFPTLVSMLRTGTRVGKIAAATVLGNMSQNTLTLLNTPRARPRRKRKPAARFPLALFDTWRWCLRGEADVQDNPVNCDIHSGLCSVETTLCLVQSGAVPLLINVIAKDMEDDVVAMAALRALATLVIELPTIREGGRLLARTNGCVSMLLGLVMRGSPVLKEKAVWVLERMFRDKDCVRDHGRAVRGPLVELAQTGTARAKRISNKVLAHLELINDNTFFLVENQAASVIFPSGQLETS